MKMEMATESEQSEKLENERALLQAAETKGGISRLLAYARLSGPGWLQSAITLGGGSLSSSLFLGVLGGVALLWIQPVAMLLYDSGSKGIRIFENVLKMIVALIVLSFYRCGGSLVDRIRWFGVGIHPVWIRPGSESIDEPRRNLCALPCRSGQ